MTTSSKETYQIYVASLADYNAGILHGAWINLEGLNADDIRDQINVILKTSPLAAKYGQPSESWAIHDYELSGIRILEHEDLETIVAIVECLEEHGQAFAIYYNDVDDLDTAQSCFEEAYQGQYDTFLVYASEIFDELYAHSIPENLRYYIDYEAFARDLESEGYFIDSGHVFRPV